MINPMSSPPGGPSRPRPVPLPELGIPEPAEAPPPETSRLRRFGAHAALGLSVLGVATPLVYQGAQNSALARAAKALEAEASSPRARADLPAFLLPAPEVAGPAALSPDGRTLVVGSGHRDGGLSLVNPADGRAMATLPGPSNRGAFLDPTRLVTWGAGRLEVRDAQTGEVLAFTKADPRDLSLEDGTLAFTQGRTLHLLEADLQGKTVDLAHPGTVVARAGGRVAVKSLGREVDQVTVVDRDGRTLLTREAWSHDDVLLTPDRLLVAGRRGDSRFGGSLTVTDLATGRDLWSQRGFEAASFSPDGTQVAAGGPRRIELKDAATGRTRWSTFTAEVVRQVRFSPDGRTVVVATGRAVLAYEAASGAKLWARQAPLMPTFAFSPDGSRLALAETLDDRQSFVTLLDAATGEDVAQVPTNDRTTALQFAGNVLLVQSEQGYYSTKLQLVDTARSPVRHDPRAEAREVLAALSSTPHENLEGVPAEVLRALHRHGVRIRAEGGTPARAPEIDAGAVKRQADRAFAEADARFAERRASLEARLEAARTEAREKRTLLPLNNLLGVIAAGDPTALDPTVQRIQADLFALRQERDAVAWGALPDTVEPPFARAGDYDPDAAREHASRPVTLEVLARGHGASTEAEVREFTDLTRRLNGERLEQAQQRFRDSVSALHPAAELPLAKRPFLPSQADLVLPAWRFQDGQRVSSRDHAALQAWREGAPYALLEDGTLLLREEAGPEAVGRAYERLLRRQPPTETFAARWRDAWWREQRWNGGSATPGEHFARRFADFTGPGRAEFERREPETARLVQVAVEAASRL